MSKTEVILTHHIVGLGGESDQVKVAAGYARNYLFPQGLAVPVSGANKRRLEALRQRRAEREAKELNSMSELGAALGKMTLTIKVKTGEDGKMFGSITSGTIADELKNSFEIALDKKKIHLPTPIKGTGDHEVELRLHSDVHTTLKVKVESSTPPPAVPEQQAAPTDRRDTPAREREARETRGHARAKAASDKAEKPAEKAEKETKKSKKS